MNSRLVVVVALLVCLMISGGAVFAHHGAGLSFDSSKKLTVKGTVTKFNWANPHAQVYFDVTDSTGNVAHWSAEMSSPGVLMRTGNWVRNTLKPGDEITIIMNPSRSGAPVGYCIKVTLPAGNTVECASIGGTA